MHICAPCVSHKHELRQTEIVAGMLKEGRKEGGVEVRRQRWLKFVACLAVELFRTLRELNCSTT
jgi:hypothetical protein